MTKEEVLESFEAFWARFQALIEANPNDADLGALVREKYAEVKK